MEITAFSVDITAYSLSKASRFCFNTEHVGKLLIRSSSQCLEIYTVELQWLKHLWDHEIMFETRVVRINEC